MSWLCGKERAVSLANYHALHTAAAAEACLPRQHAWLSQLVLPEQPAYTKQSFSELMKCSSLARGVLMHLLTSANIRQWQYAAQLE